MYDLGFPTDAIDVLKYLYRSVTSLHVSLYKSTTTLRITHRIISRWKRNYTRRHLFPSSFPDLYGANSTMAPCRRKRIRAWMYKDMHTTPDRPRASSQAALINEHTHIATDSAGALWQRRNSILYPQRMKRHIHAKLLETIVHHTQLSKDIIHLYKVKAHAGILGNECADAIAKCSAQNHQSGHDIHINSDDHPHSSIFWPARWITLVQLA
jgi:hypothetical protein